MVSVSKISTVETGIYPHKFGGQIAQTKCSPARSTVSLVKLTALFLP